MVLLNDLQKKQRAYEHLTKRAKKVWGEHNGVYYIQMLNSAYLTRNQGEEKGFARHANRIMKACEAMKGTDAQRRRVFYLNACLNEKAMDCWVALTGPRDNRPAFDRIVEASGLPKTKVALLMADLWIALNSNASRYAEVLLRAVRVRDPIKYIRTVIKNEEASS